MATTPQALLDHLTVMFPEFRDDWNRPPNCHCADDGTFTLHGVFAQFTGFFKNHVASFTQDRIAALANFVNNCMASGDEALDNAAATCFVENIAGEDCARTIAPYFNGDALIYFERWGGVPTEDHALREFLRQRRPPR
jgi:hypothetical protein